MTPNNTLMTDGTAVQPALNCYQQMALDEAVLNLAPSGVEVVRFYRWSAPALTFGFSQSLRFAEEQAMRGGLVGVPVVRRLTGGGVVFHDGDMTFSLVFDWPRLCPPQAIYGRIHRAVQLGLKAYGFACLLAPQRPLSRDGAGLCFAAPEFQDLVSDDGVKVLGGALRRRGGRGLYQGSLRPESWEVPVPELAAAAEWGLKARWGASLVSEIEPAWLKSASVLAERYKSAAWNARR